MKIFKEIILTEEFEKDLKRLKKCFKTLDSDLENFINTQLKLYHKLKIDNKGIFRLQNVSINYPIFYKAKKFACKSLKGTGSKSGIRIVYSYYPNEDIIKFIEIYYKGDKENENSDRIKKKYS